MHGSVNLMESDNKNPAMTNNTSLLTPDISNNNQFINDEKFKN